MKRFLLILVTVLLCQSADARKHKPPPASGTTKKPFTITWDAVTYGITKYTVYAYQPIPDAYVSVATVLPPAVKWTIPKGTLRGTVYAVTATTTDSVESKRSLDVVLKGIK